MAQVWQLDWAKSAWNRPTPHALHEDNKRGTLLPPSLPPVLPPSLLLPPPVPPLPVLLLPPPSLK
jgi:hypothetical protein